MNRQPIDWALHAAYVALLTLVVVVAAWWAYSQPTQCEPTVNNAMCQGNFNPDAVIDSSMVRYAPPATMGHRGVTAFK